MTAIDPETNTAYAKLDWERYAGARPPYPASLREMIYRYRRQASPGVAWSRMVDIGAGSGIASTMFAADFETVVISDPSSDNLSKARTFLEGWARYHAPSVKFEYARSRAEDAYDRVGTQVADLAICAEAAHFIDPDALMTSAAKILRPGGTLAIYSYWAPFFPTQSSRFTDAYVRMMCRTLRDSLPDDNGASMRMAADTFYRMNSGTGGLDALPIYPEYFSHPIRARFNSANGELKLRGYPEIVFELTGENAPCRIAPNETVVTYESGKDAEAEGWSFEVDTDWALNFLDSVRGPSPKGIRDSDPDIIREWLALVDEECPSGKMLAVFPATLLLATRKADS